MQIKHEFIVAGAVSDRQADLARNPGQLASHSASKRRRERVALGQLWHRRIEGLADIPHSSNRRIDIHEDPENACSVSRTRGESIYMQKIVTLVQGQVSPLFFQRPETGQIQME